MTAELSVRLRHGVLVPMLSWRAAFRFPTQEPDSLGKLLHGGLWILCCPPVGWLLALGYRREVALRLVDGVQPVLPDWRGLRRVALVNGCKAAAVILVYFLPFLALYWASALDRPAEFLEHWREIALFALLLPVCLPLTLPGLLVAFPVWHPWMSFSAAEVALLVMVFAATTWVLPGAFLQVSLHRRFRHAFRVDRAVAQIGAAPRLYLEAWGISFVATAGAIACGPLLPWGIFWSYLVIGFAFNNALVLSGHGGAKTRFKNSRMLNPSELAVAPDPTLQPTGPG